MSAGGSAESQTLTRPQASDLSDFHVYMTYMSLLSKRDLH